MKKDANMVPLYGKGLKDNQYKMQLRNRQVARKKETIHDFI